jgi:hypothetical protein
MYVHSQWVVAWAVFIIEVQRKKGALGEIAASEMKLQVTYVWIQI